MLPLEHEFDHLRFDPDEGHVVREPPGRGYGYWSGGHKVFFDHQTQQFVLFYRERTPLEKGRGGRCAVAISRDGVYFSDVWTATKEDFASSSIEVGHCVRDLNGAWKLYVSYEVESGRYWRIDVVEGPTLQELDVQGRRTVFQPQSFGQASLKDPTVYVSDDSYIVYVIGGSLNPPVVQGDEIQLGGGDATFLATSPDGHYFTTLKRIFQPPNADTWHGRRARINSVIRHGNGWLATYDGGRSMYDTYEEWCGLAWSDDGVRYERLDQSQPWVVSPHGCVRYVYAMEVGSKIHFYYEYTREDGSHDLRVSIVDRA